VFSPALASLLWASPDVPVVSCAAVGPSVAVVLSAVNFPGVLFSGIPAVTGHQLLLVSMPLLAYLLLLNFPLFPGDPAVAFAQLLLL
jgi:hypothetical protein